MSLPGMISYRGYRFELALAHRYSRADWDEKKNKDVFGSCANPHGHGHNYQIEILAPESVNHLQLKGAILKLRAEWDHQHLNFLSHFENTIPTTEAITQILFEKLRKELNTEDLKIKVEESHSLWCEIPENQTNT